MIRAVLTFVLLATLHPALIALPLFGLPSLAAGRRAEQISQRAQLAGAAPTRRSDHLWTPAHDPGRSQGAELYGIQARSYR